MNFKYRLVKTLSGKRMAVPAIPIELGENKKIKSYALIDSGADISVIPLYIAKYLNLKVEKSIQEISGAGGKVKAVKSKIQITLKKGKENHKFNIPVQIALTNQELPILLGRKGFFDNFIITFHQSKQSIKLKRTAS